MQVDKYGYRRGGKVSIKLPVAASEGFKSTGGKFVTLDANGRATLTKDSSTTLMGFLEASTETASSTAGATVRNCIIDTTAVFRVPVISGTYAATMVGKTCDIVESSDLQGVDVGASARDLVMIVDGDATDAWVDVMIVPAKQIVGGVA